MSNIKVLSDLIGEILYIINSEFCLDNEYKFITVDNKRQFSKLKHIFKNYNDGFPNFKKNIVIVLVKSQQNGRDCVPIFFDFWGYVVLNYNTFINRNGKHTEIFINSPRTIIKKIEHYTIQDNHEILLSLCFYILSLKSISENIDFLRFSPHILDYNITSNMTPYIFNSNYFIDIDTNNKQINKPFKNFNKIALDNFMIKLKSVT